MAISLSILFLFPIGVQNALGHGNVDQSFVVPFPNPIPAEPHFVPSGQSFTPTASNLVAVDVFGYSGFPASFAPDTLIVRVWDSSTPGSGNLLGTSTVIIDTTVATLVNPLRIHFDFSPIPLTPGNQYSLQLTGQITNFVGTGLHDYPGGIAWQGIPIPQADYGFVTYFNDKVVGGQIQPIDTTTLLLAGTQSFSWMLPVVLSGIGIGLFVFKKLKN